RLSAARAKLGELEKAVQEATRLSQDRQALLLSLAEQRTQRESAMAACRTRLAETSDRLERLKSDIGQSERLLNVGEERASSETEKLSTLKVEQRQVAAEKSTLDSEHNNLRDKEASTRTALEAAQRLLAERSSRLATLTELQESGEGFYQGV